MRAVGLECNVPFSIQPEHGFHLRTDQADSWRVRILKDMLSRGVEMTACVCGQEGSPILTPGDVIRLDGARIRPSDLVYFWDGSGLRIGRCLDRVWSASKVTMSVQAGLLGQQSMPVPLDYILGRIVEAWRDDEPLPLGSLEHEDSVHLCQMAS